MSLTPIADFVREYAAADVSRLHMPGHKGRGPLGCEALDLTEIAGADELYEAGGIIAASEENTARLFGTRPCSMRRPCWMLTSNGSGRTPTGRAASAPARWRRRSWPPPSTG